MTLFLGIDGGGTKTEFALIDAPGRVLATRRAGPADHVEIGMQSLQHLLTITVSGMLASLSKSPDDVGLAFVGLPGYGENSALLPKQRYRCGNDVVCGWAGALAGAQGIAVGAGTGSIAYGEYAGRSARAGGWGELFSDEGSAFWLAREALALFSRMNDGRAPQGPLHELIRDHFGVTHGLGVCAKVYRPPALSRSEIAALVHAVRDALKVEPHLPLTAAYCGGLMQPNSLLLPLFAQALSRSDRTYDLRPPRLTPALGAAVFAATLARTLLGAVALERLQKNGIGEDPQ